LTVPLMRRSPPAASAVLAPPSTVPAAVSARVLVRLKPSALKLPSVEMALAWLSVVAPADCPLSVPAVIRPVAVWLIEPADFRLSVVALIVIGGWLR